MEKPSLSDTILVPAFHRLDDYFGVWAIEPSRAWRLWEVAGRMDLALHVAQAESAPAPAPRSDIVRVETVSGGKQIAIIRAMGPLMKQRASLSPGTSTVQLRRDIRTAAADLGIGAILLAIDSPGGTVAGTHDLARDVAAAREKKPVWAQVEDLGASAAYWIASQAEKVFANSTTALVGSIGTMMTVYDASVMAEKEGVKALVFATGPLKGSGVPGTVITAEQQAYFQRIIDQSQEEFDRAVRDGRGFTAAQLSAVRSGEVFGAAEGLRLGLIDGVQSMDETMAQLARVVMGAKKGVARAERGGKMEEAISAAPAVPVAMPVLDPVTEFRTKMAAESERVAAVQRICDGMPSLAAKGISEGWDSGKAELEVLRAQRPTPAIISRSHDRDCTIQALQGAMLLRGRVALDSPLFAGPQALALNVPSWLRAGLDTPSRARAMEAAWRYRDLSAIDLCREAIRLDGRDCPHGRTETIQAAFSSASLTNIFTTSVNAVLLVSYMEAGDTTGGWTSETEVADFKTQERPRLGKGPNLERLPRDGTADHYSRSDVVETYKIARYAKQFQVDEQDIIDDSLGALSDMPREMGLAAARLRPDLVYAILLRNAALGADSVALFHANHANLNTTASLQSSKLIAGIAAVEKQRENGVNLNLRVSHLIVPSDLKHTGAELIQSSTILLGADDESVRGAMNTVNAIESLSLVADARLANGVIDPVDGASQSGSATTWYLASAMAHTIEVAYLRGSGRAPQVRSFMLDKGQWGMGWDIKMDIGAKALDYRGLQKNTA